MLSFSVPALADSGSLTVAQVVNPGILTLQASDHAELSAVTISHTQGQTSTGVLSPATIDDSRGIAAGWYATATVSNLVSYTTFTDIHGRPGPFTVHGTYNRSSDADFTLKTGDPFNGTNLEQIEYSLTESTNVYNHALELTQALGETGLSFDAPDTAYQPWSIYHLHVHVIPVNGLTVTPSGLTILAGQSDGVTGGSAYTLADINDPVMLAMAEIGSGEGLYQIGADLQLAVPPGTHPGTYNGVIIETVN